MKDLEICEVGPRDGLQSLGLKLDIEQRFLFVENLIRAGITRIEVGSIVNPKYVPEMAESDRLYERLIQKHGADNQLALGLLVPNTRGLEIAMNLGCKYFAFFTATSESFNKKNINMTLAESVTQIKKMLSLLGSTQATKRLYLSTVFHCAYEGKMDVKKILYFEDIFSEFDEISLGDTTGKAEPEQLAELCNLLKEKPYREKIWWHFHDTFQLAETNVLHAINHGYAKFDSSAGGIGGCPFSPGARGNIATEKLIKTATAAGLHARYDTALIEQAGAGIQKLKGQV